MSDFEVIIPLQKGLDDHLNGIASTTSIDRDEERMSEKALQMMVRDIKTQGVNLFENHEHGWDKTLGVIKDATLQGNAVAVDITLDDASTNPKIPMLLNKLKRGIKLGLSVGGNVTNFKWEYDRALGKKVKVLDEVKIYEVSVVGIPSNADSYLNLAQAIAKSAQKGQPPLGQRRNWQRLHDKYIREGYSESEASKLANEDTETIELSCPICLHKMANECPQCLYKGKKTCTSCGSPTFTVEYNGSREEYCENCSGSIPKGSGIRRI